MGRRQINDEELNALFLLYGQGIWYLQVLEDVLHTTITLKHELRTPGTISQEEAESLLARHRRKTLGQSLQFSRKNQVLDTDLQEKLEKFKEERDWLLHRSVIQNGDDLYDDEKREVLINRLKSFLRDAVSFRKFINQELEDFNAFHGISPEMVMKEAQEWLGVFAGQGPGDANYRDLMKRLAYARPGRHFSRQELNER